MHYDKWCMYVSECLSRAIELRAENISFSFLSIP